MDKSKSCQNKENKSKQSKGNHNSNWSFEKLNKMIEKVNYLLQQYEFEEARKISELILQKFPMNPEAWELGANVAIEVSDRTTALKYLNKAIAINPFSGYSNYLSKAQLLEGKESLACYLKAAEIIKVELKKVPKLKLTNGSNTQGNEENMECDIAAPTASDGSMSLGECSTSLRPESQSSLSRELSSVYCCITELYFTDLSMEPDAEEAAMNYVNLAITANANNPEASITKARCLHFFGDAEGAKNELESSRSLWTPPDVEKTDDLTWLEEFAPSCKLAAAKLFIELDMFEDATKMLDCLLLEDDEVVEVHYLLGLTAYLQKDYPLAKQYLLDAKKTHRKCPCDDEGILGHMKELLTEIIGMDDKGMEGDDDSEEWEDDDDDEQLEREIIEQAERAEREN